jgi:ferric-dicitrate binding protein FerR (iron transport regulator)
MNKNNLIERPDWELLGKYLSHETNFAETEQVEKWVGQSGENRKELDKIRLILEQADSVYRLKHYNPENGWEKVNKTINADRYQNIIWANFSKTGLKAFMKYAAIILVALMLGTAGYFIGFRNPLQEIYTSETAGSFQNTEDYVLPDGSVVTLNSRSKIVFPKQFKGEIREVTITGEAFFEVKPNPEKPFVINAGEAKIKVLGTSFNVSAYPENEKVEVVVESGRVEVSHIESDSIEKNARISLTRGEKGTLLKNDKSLEKSRNNDQNYLAWKTHNLIFEETPLSKVISHLKKTYHIDIEISDKELNNLVLTAEFDNKPVDFVLNVVQLTFDLNLTKENNRYTFSKKMNENN